MLICSIMLIQKKLKKSWRRCMIFCLYVFHVFSTSEAQTKLGATSHRKHKLSESIIIFGDSIVDPGNNNNLPTFTKCNFPPYGRDFCGGVATGRFTNGKTPMDILAQILGIKDLVPAYLDSNLRDDDLRTGVSFASGGCGYDNETDLLLPALSLWRQLDMFKEYNGRLKGVVGEEKANKIVRGSLYLVVVGTNDLATTYFNVGFRRLEYNVHQYTDFLVAAASNFLQEMYKLGARKIGVVGAPPIGCLPFQRTVHGGPYRSCSTKQNKVAQLYNTKLSSKLNSLNSTLPQSKLVYIDIYNPLNDIIHRPKKYGFDVVDRGCCGTGTLEVGILCNKMSPTCSDATKYLFWDSFHPTEQGYKVCIQKFVRKIINEFA